MSARLVIVDPAFGDGEVEKAAVAGLDVEVEYRPAADPAALQKALKGADGMIVQYRPIPKELIGELSQIRVIGRYGIGYDNVDVAAASSANIGVINVPDYCAEEVAQHTAALILSAWRRLPQAAALVAQQRWNDWNALAPIRPLSQCTLGLVGSGRIGHEVIRQIGAVFGRTMVFDPYEASLPDHVDRAGSMAQLLGSSDVVSLHCPLNAETEKLINADMLALMRPGSLLVNVSRGGLVDSSDLAAALRTGRPAHAALDVLDVEPPVAGHPLLDHPAVLQTPHIAWYSSQSLISLRQLLARRCADYLLGRPVPTLVNKNELGPRN